MPPRRRPRRRARGNISKVILFWTAFFAVVALLFVINIPKITRTWQNVFGTRGNVSIEPAPLHQTERPPPAEFEGESSSVRISAQPEETLSAPADAPETAPPYETAALPPSSPIEQYNAPIAPPQQTRERTVYLVRVDSAGLVFLTPVKRQSPVNESPLVTTLGILLQGPAAMEKQQGILSLVPDGTRVLSAAVDRGIATINFNENFMFNSFGAEGYIAQLKQIIWTATEFPNIQEVQIQVEGRRVEYLGETIRLDRPLSRDSF